MKLKIGIAVIILSLTLNAQDKKYPFVNYSENYIKMGRDSSAMMQFYIKLHELCNGNRKELVIAHIGGSHVQGGFWGDELSVRLQTFAKTTGGGIFAFPFQFIKSNTPPYYHTFTNGKWKRCRSALSKEFCPAIGMAGVTAASNDSTNYFGVKLDSTHRHPSFNCIRVYHNFNSSFTFSISGHADAIREEKANDGYTLFKLNKPIDSVRFVLQRSDTLQKDFILYGFDLRNSLKPGIYYAALGSNGASTQSVLRCSKFEPQLKSIAPDLIILSLGVNDVQDKNFSERDFIQHYDSLINRIKEAAPHAAILFTTVSDNFIRRRTPNKRSNVAESSFGKIMEQYGAAEWDWFQVMGGYKSILKWIKAGYAKKDRVHFTARGYYLVADLMADALIKSYQNSFRN